MVAVEVWLIVVLVLLILSIGLQLEARYSAKDYLEDYDEALDEMRNSLNVVAQVLHKLPEMVPQFQINENPLSQIIQFFQQRSEQQNQADTSLGAVQVRDDNGRFETDGTKEETT